MNEIGDVCPNPNKVWEAEIETALSAPVCAPDITSLTGSVSLPSLIKLAWTLAPELLIASLIPSKVLLLSSMVTSVTVVPTVMEIVPLPISLDVSENPDERSLVSRARLLTTKENVPDVAALVVVRLATSLLSVELLFEKTPVVVRKRDSVLRVLTTLLKFCRRSLRS